jgi:hypothetical protein
MNKKRLENIIKLDKKEEFKIILEFSVRELYNIFSKDNYKEILLEKFKIDKEEISFYNIMGIIKEKVKKKSKNPKEDEEYLTLVKDFVDNFEEKLKKK